MIPDRLDMDLPETEKFTVQLKKDENGLGITIAGNLIMYLFLFILFVNCTGAHPAASLFEMCSHSRAVYIYICTLFTNNGVYYLLFTC